jgi:hypothetical protein
MKPQDYCQGEPELVLTLQVVPVLVLYQHEQPVLVQVPVLVAALLPVPVPVLVPVLVLDF